jgi:hypothetical protein
MPPCRSALKDMPYGRAETRVLDRHPSRQKTLCHQDQAAFRLLNSHEQPTQNVEEAICFSAFMWFAQATC